MRCLVCKNVVGSTWHALCHYLELLRNNFFSEYIWKPRESSINKGGLPRASGTSWLCLNKEIFLRSVFEKFVYITPPLKKQSVHHISQTLYKLQDYICREVDIFRNNLHVIRKTVGDTIQRWGLCLGRGNGHVESDAA